MRYWSDCWYKHAIGCTLAEKQQSYELRIAVDRKLKRCVEAKGHPVIAWIMYAGVRVLATMKGGY